jgi:hypothetical protein
MSWIFNWFSDILNYLGKLHFVPIIKFIFNFRANQKEWQISLPRLGQCGQNDVVAHAQG